MGHKGGRGRTKHGLTVSEGPGLERRIAAITGIADTVLHDYGCSAKLTTEERLSWISSRTTTKSEDLYYSLLGIFDVKMNVLYGEGAENARQRLLRKVAKRGRRQTGHWSIGPPRMLEVWERRKKKVHLPTSSLKRERERERERVRVCVCVFVC